VPDSAADWFLANHKTRIRNRKPILLHWGIDWADQKQACALKNPTHPDMESGHRDHTPEAVETLEHPSDHDHRRILAADPGRTITPLPANNESRVD
jgi:hypothetical protein